MHTASGNYPVAAGTGSDASHAATSVSGSFWIDVTAPSVPIGLKGTIKGSKVSLSWTASSDGTGSGVALYRVFRGATQVGTSSSTTFSNTPGNGTWTYSVVAEDKAGNQSAASASVTVTVGRK